MRELHDVDLRKDPHAAHYAKDETVQVTFAPDAGQLISREGANRYAKGDALVTGATGDRWSVSRARFDAKYEALAPLKHGVDGAYRNLPIPVLARQMGVPFCVARSAGGDLLHGKAGDWLVQYAPGDYGIVDAKRFDAVYRRAVE